MALRSAMSWGMTASMILREFVLEEETIETASSVAVQLVPLPKALPRGRNEPGSTEGAL